MLVFIIDYLQKQSKEFEPDNRLGYNPVKEVFEISTVTSLIQMISFENNIFERDIFEELNLKSVCRNRHGIIEIFSD